MNKTIYKLMIIILCILFLAMTFNRGLTVDFMHLLTCNEEDCNFCDMIHYTQNSINDLILITVSIWFSIIGIYQIFKIFNKNYFTSKTLIHSNVQLNE